MNMSEHYGPYGPLYRQRRKAWGPGAVLTRDMYHISRVRSTLKWLIRKSYSVTSRGLAAYPAMILLPTPSAAADTGPHRTHGRPAHSPSCPAAPSSKSLPRRT